MADGKGLQLGRRIAPPRFIAFVIVLAAGIAGGVAWLGWREGVMAGFDLAAAEFLLSVLSLFNNETDSMRRAAERNDANRTMLLAITSAVMIAVLVAVAAELGAKNAHQPVMVALIIGTLVLAWLFSNMIYALHYAHIFYTEGDDGKDQGGLDFPGDEDPDYWDFVYFAFTLGMTFQTSDVETCSKLVRRVVILHCFAAFVFNIGVLAFTINVLGGGG